MSYLTLEQYPISKRTVYDLCFDLYVKLIPLMLIAASVDYWFYNMELWFVCFYIEYFIICLFTLWLGITTILCICCMCIFAVVLIYNTYLNIGYYINKWKLILVR